MILSIVGIILEEMKTNVIPINPTIIRVMRVLRIARGKYDAACGERVLTLHANRELPNLSIYREFVKDLFTRH